MGMQYELFTDLSSLTVLPQESQFSAKSHGLTVRHENLMIFGKPNVFQRKSTIFLSNRCSRIKPFTKSVIGTVSATNF